jgi:hypothetical protein
MYIWTWNDVQKLIRRMEHIVLEHQAASYRTLQNVDPDVEDWTPEVQGTVLKSLGKWTNDGTPISELGVGEGILPSLRLAQEKIENKTLTSMEVFNFYVIFLRTDHLRMTFNMASIFTPWKLNGKVITDISDLGINMEWIAQHMEGFRD